MAPTDTFEINRERAIDYLNTRDNVYVFDGYAGVSVHYVTSALALIHVHSGIPSTALKCELSAREPITPCSW